MGKKGIVLAVVLLLVTGCYIVPVPDQRVSPAEPAEQWVPIAIRATGGGAPPERAINPAQARLMTERAARLDAYRNLLERAYGVAIQAKSTVRDFVLKDDTIRSRVEAYIRGAKVIDTVYKDDGGVEVEMEVVLGHEFRRIFR
ncbi:MAG: LPP20 family lipoprotein [Thermodesulfobacteriota bacterium]